MDKNMNLFDLIAAFFRWIGKVCAGFWHLCLNSLRLSLHYWYISLSCIILFAGLGIFFSRHDNRIYKAEAIVYLNGPRIEDVKQVYKPIVDNSYIFQDQNLIQMLGLTPDEAVGIRRFQVFNVIDYLNDSTVDEIDYKNKHKLTDTVNVVMNNVLCLQFQTKHPENVQVVGDKLLAYLNTNPSLVASYEKKHALMERKVKFCHDQLEKLDSLTTAFYFEQGGDAQAQMRWGNGMVLGRREIKLFTGDIMDFYNSTEKADRELAMCYAPVVMQQHFTICPRAINNRILCTFIGLLAGYILGCLIALAVYRRKELQKWYKGE